MVDGKATNQRSAYYDFIKFAVEKEAKRNFAEAKKTRDLTSKPKATMQFCFNSKKSTFPVTHSSDDSPSPRGRTGEGEAMSLPSEESDS